MKKIRSGGGWGVADMGGVTHHVPLDDLRFHTAGNCDCNPRIDENNVYHHTSYDGREAFELGIRKPS